MSSPFVVDTENLQLDVRDLARLNEILTSTAPHYPQDTENLQLDAGDLARLGSALNSMMGMDSHNLKLSPHDIAVLKPHIHGGPPPHYVAKAVNFQAGAWLSADGDLLTPESSFISFSWWVYYPTADVLNDANDTFGFFVNSGANGGAALGNDWNTSTDVSLGALFTNGNASRYAFVSPAGVLSPGQWYNFLGSIDVGHDAGLRVTQFYLNDVTPAGMSSSNGIDTGVAFTIPTSKTTGTDTATTTIVSQGNSLHDEWVSDPWIAPGVLIDFSVEANRRKFISASGKPVYLGANGELPTGTAPLLFFSGDADHIGTNRGTSPLTFVTNGTLTNASTSPSD